MSWLEPKTDWNSTDYYNAHDLNRVESNTAEVIAFLQSIQFDTPTITAVTNRDNTRIEYISSINRVESNIDTIKNKFLTPPGWQSKKTWTTGPGFNYQDANRLESNLELLYEYAQLAAQNIVYCGLFACGEEVLINAMA